MGKEQIAKGKIETPLFFLVLHLAFSVGRKIVYS